MSRRWLSIQLPEWPIERMASCARRRGEPFPGHRPLALVLAQKGIPRLVALNALAASRGLRVGLSLTDARAALPELELRDAEPWTDAAALASLALWCGRWSPKTAADGADAVLLDITGCAHLWGGEAGLLVDVAARFTKLGFTHRLAIADRRLAAWAWARLGQGGILPAPAATTLLEALPAAALRLEPELETGLTRLGLRRVGQVGALPGSSLQARFGAIVPERLAQLLGQSEAPFTSLQAPRRFLARLSFAEPIGRTTDIEAAIRRLAWQLGVDLDRAQAGVRVLGLGLHRVDGEVARLEVRLGRPSRDADHLAKLLAMRLDGLDIGFGIELLILEAIETAPLGPEQCGLAEPADARELARLVDQLTLRLGLDRVVRLAPADSHIPERAQRLLPANEPAPTRPWLARQPRPARLLARPVPVAAMAALPDGPPVRLRWQNQVQRVTAAAGPERILPEWWRPAQPAGRPRDYYRVTVEDGRTFWVYRAGTYTDPIPPTWHLHGSFA